MLKLWVCFLLQYMYMHGHRQTEFFSFCIKWLLDFRKVQVMWALECLWKPFSIWFIKGVVFLWCSSEKWIPVKICSKKTKRKGRFSNLASKEEHQETLNNFQISFQNCYFLRKLWTKKTARICNHTARVSKHHFSVNLHF